MVVLVLDDVMTDLRPVKNRASRNVCGWIFDQTEDAADRDAAPSVRVDAELRDANQFVQNHHVARRNVDIGDERNGVTFMNEGGPSGNDDGVAHGDSSLGISLTETHADELVGRYDIGDDFPEVNGVRVDFGDDAVVGGIDFLAG